MRGSAAVAHTSRGIPNEWPAEAPYDDTDSEHEQPFWRLGSDRSRRQDDEESTDSSSSSSDGGTDDETNAERGRRFRCGAGSHARRSDRRVARGGRAIDVVQSDWNDAMTSSAVPTGAGDDRGITYDTKATREARRWKREMRNDEDVGIFKKSQGGNEKFSVAEEVGHDRSKVSGHRASGAEKCDTQERRLSLSANAETAAHGGAPPATRTEDEHDPPALNSSIHTERSSFERRVRQRAERFGTEERERGDGGDATAAGRSDVERSGDDEPRRSSSSRVHRVADFAKWATRVAEEAAADAASASSSVDWRRERRRRKAAKSVAATTAVPVGSTTTAADSHQDAGAAERVAGGDEADRLGADRDDPGSDHSVQIGARAHRTASAGGGSRVTATSDDAVG